MIASYVDRILQLELGQEIGYIGESSLLVSERCVPLLVLAASPRLSMPRELSLPKGKQGNIFNLSSICFSKNLVHIQLRSLCLISRPPGLYLGLVPVTCIVNLINHIWLSNMSPWSKIFPASKFLVYPLGVHVHGSIRSIFLLNHFTLIFWGCFKSKEGIFTVRNATPNWNRRSKVLKKYVNK